MSLAGTRADPPAEPFTLAGLPPASWAYALRVWIAMMVALYAAFWLQLDSASSSAVTVAILAQPRRGQAFSKAAARIAATVLGVTMSIVITGLFAQSRDLFVIAFATWLSLCVFVASCYDGNRAYGAVLSGYTVAIISVGQIDSPQDVFTNGMARLAVVSLGIASIALINDVFAAPDVYPDLRRRLYKAKDDTNALVEGILRDVDVAPQRVVGLLGTITALRLDILTLPSERPSGGRRSGAARSAVAAMIGAIGSARMLLRLAPHAPAGEIAELRTAIADDALAPLEAEIDRDVEAGTPDPERLMRVRFAADIIERRRLVARELAAMDGGGKPTRQIDLPIHRDREFARRKAIRIFVALLGSAFVLIQSSWPQTSVCLTLLGVTAGLSATTPDAKAFAKGAMIAMPLAVAAAGITEFIILDGVDKFPLLAIGMAPVVFIACFMFLNPKTSGLGFLMLVFFPVILSPANPQSYNPQTYIYTGILAVTAVFMLALCLNLFPSTTDKERRRWLVNRTRKDLIEVLANRRRRTAPEGGYLTAERALQIAKLQIGGESGRRQRLRYTLFLSTLTVAAGRAQTALDGLRDEGFPAPDIAAARAAFLACDPGAMRGAAETLARAAPGRTAPERHLLARAIADLHYVAQMEADGLARLRHLRRVLDR